MRLFWTTKIGFALGFAAFSSCSSGPSESSADRRSTDFDRRCEGSVCVSEEPKTSNDPVTLSCDGACDAITPDNDTAESHESSVGANTDSSPKDAKDTSVALDASIAKDTAGERDALIAKDSAVERDALANPNDPKACLRGSGDYAEPGPYRVETTPVELDLSDSELAFTIFHPAELEEDCLHPIVVWGNGTGVSGTEPYLHLHNHAASWGLVVMACHNEQPVIECFYSALDFLIDQNDDPTSFFYQKLYTLAGVAGHSQGGFKATEANAHSNVIAEVCIHGGGTPAANVAFLCLTGENGFMKEACEQAYRDAEGPAFFANHAQADHVITPTITGQTTPAGIQFMRLYVAWFRCFLHKDPNACALFEGGESCGICDDPNWAVLESRNF